MLNNFMLKIKLEYHQMQVYLRIQRRQVGRYVCMYTYKMQVNFQYIVVTYLPNILLYIINRRLCVILCMYVIVCKIPRIIRTKRKLRRQDAKANKIKRNGQKEMIGNNVKERRITTGKIVFMRYMYGNVPFLFIFSFLFFTFFLSYHHHHRHYYNVYVTT